MAKKTEDEAPAGSPAWMATFSDLMNLLLCFFVLLFSMSSTDAGKFEEVAASLAASFSILPSGGSALSSEGVLVNSGASQLNELSTYYNSMGLNAEGETDTEVQDAYEQVQEEGQAESEQMAEEITESLAASNVADQVEVTATSKYVVLNLSGGVLFESGSYAIREDAKTLLKAVSVAIKEYDGNIISIEGHTDNVPMHSAQIEDNMMLSLYRAYSVYRFFVDEYGFSEETMTSSGRGENVPIATNETAEGRALNRRVEIKIYNNINS
ncbi:flagellar motor protein MotB [Lachnospira sp.]|jgi:chemotaxis protein MotB|uniref:flagellar motor protein MotB n=1 Tax=Lachnospira sp. TaxID=2049031 RepID=UPI00257F93DB|nr:flagellar motor protein MotB [Lachnospira sp.]